MTLIPRYLVSDRTLLVSNETGFVTEYRPVYQKNLSIYKGIVNNLEFQLLNPDQKAVALTGKTPKFVAFDENQNLVIEHSGTVTNSNKGIFTVAVTENDTLSIKQQYLSYNIYLVDDTTNEKTLTYADEQLQATGTIYVSAQAFPGPSATHSVTTFTEDTGIAGQDDSVWYSEAISAEPAINGNEALHTAVVYSTAYTGDVVVQATLENQVVGNTEWADVTTLTFTGSETEPTPINFNGVYSFLRFKTTANPANTITKILVRN
jgi:hypothetical protein